VDIEIRIDGLEKSCNSRNHESEAYSQLGHTTVVTDIHLAILANAGLLIGDAVEVDAATRSSASRDAVVQVGATRVAELSWIRQTVATAFGKGFGAGGGAGALIVGVSLEDERVALDFGGIGFGGIGVGGVGVGSVGSVGGIGGSLDELACRHKASTHHAVLEVGGIAGAVVRSSRSSHVHALVALSRFARVIDFASAWAHSDG